MTREEARRAAEVMLAYADGKEIEHFDDFGIWEKCDNPSFTWMNDKTYRVKPNPTCYPFKNAEECWDEMKKHKPFGWVKSKVNGNLFTINRLNGYNDDKRIMKDMFNNCTFADGEPFGKMAYD